jgi:hypothetical protein
MQNRPRFIIGAASTAPAARAASFKNLRREIIV